MTRRAASTSLCGKHLDRRPAQPAAVDDAGVIQLVRDDDVVLRRGWPTTVPALAAKPLWKTTTASIFLNSASRRSSSMWIAIVPAIVRTEPDPTPNRSMRLERARAQPRMRRQPEVVVRREIDDRSVVERRVRPLFVFENAKAPVEVLLLQRVELVTQVRKRIAAHAGSIVQARDRRGRRQRRDAGSRSTSISTRRNGQTKERRSMILEKSRSLRSSVPPCCTPVEFEISGISVVSAISAQSHNSTTAHGMTATTR